MLVRRVHPTKAFQVFQLGSGQFFAHRSPRLEKKRFNAEPAM
jgi:hypothetical protein